MYHECKRRTPRLLLLALMLGPAFLATAQEPESTGYYAGIKKYDLGRLWRADSISIEDPGDNSKIAFPEPLGYIGDNYQRFYIHYTSVTKSSKNPYEYRVRGKTRVKNNICNFTGTITVLSARLYKESDDPPYKQGWVDCKVVFYEDSTEHASGVIKGRLTTSFFLDEKDSLYYDALMLVADSYSNNQCEATWTSYKTGKPKKCNWGDFRIPDSKMLDSGAGDVAINEKYIHSGWESFVATYSSDEEKSRQALQIENRKWWK